jgi:hypothetical protein
MAKRTKDAQDWIEEIDDALIYREKYAMEAAWNQIEMDYLNDPTGHTAVGPNIVHSMGDSLMSNLQAPTPEFVVTPERQNAIGRAPIVESLDNYLLTKLRLKKYINAALLNGYLTSSIIVKIGYDSEFSWSPFYDIGPSNQLMGMSFTQFNKRGERIESPDIQPGWPWVRPVRNSDFVVPWGTLFLEDAPWVAHRIVRHIDHIKSDPKYKNTSRLQGQITMEEYMQSYAGVGARKSMRRSRQRGIAKEPRPAEFVELWEIRDMMTGKILVVSRDSEDFLRNENDAIQLACGCPFVATSLVQSPSSFWSTPLAYYLGQIQATEFDIALQAEKQRRISILKFLYRKGAITPAALTRLLSGDVGAAEGVDSTFPLNEIITPVNTGSSFDFALYSQRNRENAREAVGFSSNQLGDYDKSSRRTAREATFVAAGSQQRTGRQTSLVSDLYIDVIKKVNNLIFEFWRVPREIMNGSGWVYTTGDQLKGDYLYDIGLSYKRQISKAERKVEALSMLPMLAQIPGIDIKALMQMLSDASADVNFERMLSPITGSEANDSVGAGQQPGGLPTIPGTGA